VVAQVGAVAKYIEGCIDREREMMEYLAPAEEEQPEETSNADDDDDEDGDEVEKEEDDDHAGDQANTEEQSTQERIEEEQSKVEEDEDEEEEEEKREEEEKEVDPSKVRDEARWQESAWEHEWFAFLACRAEDYLQLQGAPSTSLRGEEHKTSETYRQPCFPGARREAVRQDRVQPLSFPRGGHH